MQAPPSRVSTHAIFRSAFAAHQAGRLAEARDGYANVISQDGRHADAFHLLGLTHMREGRLEEAERLIRKALELTENAIFLGNLAVLLKASQRLEEAEAAYRRALELDPDATEVRLNLGHLLLTQQRYEEGWSLYELRFATRGASRKCELPDLPYPRWQGESLEGKSLVLWREQGCGDCIQFVRYVSLLRARGVSHLTVVCLPVLAHLIETVAGVDAVTTRMSRLRAHDYWVPMMSLPLLFGTRAETIPAAPMPYLHALPARVARWRARVPDTGLRVGLAWRGNPGHTNDANRSLPGLSSLAPLWSVPGVSFVSLQKGHGESEATQPPPGQPLLALGPELLDFSDTAAVVSQLDLIICVDTAVAHLAGAMGKPCWVLLPALGSDWRWQLNRRDSPWYPTIRLFRQAKAGDWNDTVEAVVAALLQWCSPSRGAQVLECAPERPPVLTGPSTFRDAFGAHQVGRLEQASVGYREVLAQAPDHADALHLLGLVRMEQGHVAEAEDLLRQALALNENSIFLGNLGILLKRSHRLAQAEAAYRRALELKPDYADIWSHLGNLLVHCKRSEEAHGAYERALAIEPGHHKARTHLGLLYLLQGRYRDGWPLYEGRCVAGAKGSPVALPELPYPRWQGESLAGKSLLICPEQGFGDYIQCVRYVPLIKALGVARLTLVCSAALLPLFETLAGVDAVAKRYAQLPAHDYWALVMSLPLHFATTVETIPVSSIPYVHAEPARIARWQAAMPRSGLKVGLVWKGSPTHANDANRSMDSLTRLQPLWSVADVSFISLQKGAGEDEASCPPEGQALVALGGQLQDFADTAAVISQLDLLICVDTAVAHLAGAMGKPCWVLLPFFGTDWRWHLHRTDSPWYPSIRLFRQTQDGDWGETVREVAVALAQWRSQGQLAQVHDTVQPPPAVDVASLLHDAMTAHQAGRLAQAQAGYLDVLSHGARHADALHLLGLVHVQGGDFGQAEALIRRALEIKENAIFQGNLATLLNQTRRPAEAEAAFRRTLQLQPDHVDAHFSLGNLLMNRDAQGAQTFFRRALQLHPDHFDARLNLANLLQRSDEFAQAEAEIRYVLARAPDHAHAHYNLGNLYKRCNRIAECEAAYRRTLRIQPDHVGAHVNLGNLLALCERWTEAHDAFQRALELEPGHALARMNLGFLLLTQQRFREAWPHYEYRYAAVGMTLPDLAYPRWRGEPLEGKTLVICPEQGFGDYIQFVRYAPMLQARGARRVTVVCSPALADLLGTAEGVDAVATDYSQVAANDYWCLAASLPLHCGTAAQTIPASPMPYLHALPVRVDRWRDRLPRAGFKVGLVWKGSLTPDPRRSLADLAGLAPLWTVPGVTFVSLQKGRGEEEAASPPADQPILAWGEEIQDFADSAAIVSLLDLVISIDTSVAHLAAAMAKPCWVLLPATGADWRWQADRVSSPWYPSIRLFRQKQAGDWSQAVHDIASALAQCSREASDAHAIFQRGNVLKGQGRLREAQAAYRHALEVDPGLLPACLNLGNLMMRESRLADAEAAYRRALEVKPDYALARMNLGMLYLEQGRYAQGWPLYESRYAAEVAMVKVPDIPFPQWKGEPLTGKSLVIYSEQGLGDCIQFARYASLLKRQGASRLTLACRPAVAELLSSVEGIDTILTGTARGAPYDYWAFAASLPLHCGTTPDNIPVDPMPYVRASTSRTERWRTQLNLAGRKVGLAWKGNRNHANDANRSLPGLECLAPLWAVPGMSFVSLQKGRGQDEAASPPPSQALLDLGAHLENFADTAAIVSQLDLVICVDTAVAHLAGALGKPCWVLLPAVGTDWRWQLHQTSSPWYPSIRLFRQKRPGDWGEAVAEVAAALLDWSAPGDASACVKSAIELLSLGLYAQAWPLYESRYADGNESAIRGPRMPVPRWQGECLAGKSLAIWPEQGFGDYIQFVRYVPLLKARGVAHLAVVCPPALAALLVTVQGVDMVVTDLSQIPPHEVQSMRLGEVVVTDDLPPPDYWTFLMSLPLHFGTTLDTIPVTPLPYVHALPSRLARWTPRLPSDGQKKVGLVWKGRPEHANDANRSLPGLQSLAPLWAVPGVSFIGLQKGVDGRELAKAPAGRPFVNLGDPLEDFADTAAVIGQLDLLVCVDTAVAHLAAAMGKPCWILLPAVGTDWRWHRNRADSPWYPSVRLFRQTTAGDWSPTVESLAQSLRAFAVG